MLCYSIIYYYLELLVIFTVMIYCCAFKMIRTVDAYYLTKISYRISFNMQQHLSQIMPLLCSFFHGNFVDSAAGKFVAHLK